MIDRSNVTAVSVLEMLRWNLRLECQSPLFIIRFICRWWSNAELVQFWILVAMTMMTVSPFKWMLYMFRRHTAVPCCHHLDFHCFSWVGLFHCFVVVCLHISFDRSGLMKILSLAVPVSTIWSVGHFAMLSLHLFRLIQGSYKRHKFAKSSSEHNICSHMLLIYVVCHHLTSNNYICWDQIIHYPRRHFRVNEIVKTIYVM